jgi:hypothetical protein
MKPGAAPGLPPDELARLRDAWMARWPEALRLWGSFVRLPDPRFCATRDEERDLGLIESFAAIRLSDHAVVLSPAGIAGLGLQGFPLEILGHEIGHHVLCPADLADMGRMIARMRRSLPTVEAQAPMISNLYTDLLINDRLYRQHGLRMDAVYAKLDSGAGAGDPLWQFYLRTYEILWGLGKRTLARGEITPEMEGDAQLANRVVRSFADDWVRGSGRFAALCLPYLLKSADRQQGAIGRLLDAAGAGPGEPVPGGLAEIEDDETADAVHPALEAEDGERQPEEQGPGSSGGNYREPFEYGQILKAMGIRLSEAEIASRYYRERALPHLVPFPRRELPVGVDPLPEGLDLWDVGDSLDRINWNESVLRSPVVVPGYTTVETHYGADRGSERHVEPVDLDLYIDSSGSMPNPRVQTSYLALAGAIIALSALRAGSKVQATLWSGAGEFRTTGGFTSDQQSILAVITDYLGDGTAYPIHLLRDTYRERRPDQRKVHILNISDDGIDTIYNRDERGSDGKDIAAMALAAAGGGGTMVLNVYGDWTRKSALAFAAQQGWDIHPVTGWEQLLAFSRAFARKHYDRADAPAGGRS